MLFFLPTQNIQMQKCKCNAREGGGGVDKNLWHEYPLRPFRTSLHFLPNLYIRSQSVCLSPFFPLT